MTGFLHSATFWGGVSLNVTGITALSLQTTGSMGIVYAASRSGEMLSAWQLDASGQLQLLSELAYSPGATGFGALGMEFLSLGGVEYLLPSGLDSTSVLLHGLLPAGGFSGTTLTPGGADFTTGATAIESVVAGGTTYVYAAQLAMGGIGVYALNGTGPVTLLDAPVPDGAVQGVIFSDLVAADIGGTQFLFGADTAGDQVLGWQIAGNGALTQVSVMGAIQGLGLAGPTAMKIAIAENVPYLVVAASGSSSLTVMAPRSDGSLTPVDHIIDDLNTRFQAPKALEIVEINGRSFIITGGGDDGLSLFTLLPGGQLLHLDTIEDTAALSLNNVSAISARAVGGMIELVVSGSGEAGITVFTIDPGTIGGVLRAGNAGETITGTGASDMITGGNGDDILSGGDGDDIIIDGGGSDQLTGGSGQDIFVLGNDGTPDSITDFNINQDRVDLTGTPFLRSIRQISFLPTTDGVILTYGSGEQLQLYSHDGSSLTAGDFTTNDLISMSRMAVGTVQSSTVATQTGTDGNDTLTGDQNPDNIYGMGGADFIVASGGFDVLYGGDGDDILIGGGGADALYGGAGHDRAGYSTAPAGVSADLLDPSANTGDAAGDIYSGIEDLAGSVYDDILYGDAIANFLSGNAGNDLLYARGGDDFLHGGLGADILDGGPGADRLDGGGGADQLYGGDGVDFADYSATPYGLSVDFLIGSVSNGLAAGDIFSSVEGLIGSAFDDLLRSDHDNNIIHGGAGNDYISARIGDDIVYGEDGDDIIVGGLGADQLFGGSGSDRVGFVTSLYGVKVDFENTSANAGHALGDTYDSIEHIAGTYFDDILLADGGNNDLFAMAGADYLNGRDGDDRLFGGPGDDVLIGGAGADVLSGGDGKIWSAMPAPGRALPLM